MQLIDDILLGNDESLVSLRVEVVLCSQVLKLFILLERLKMIMNCWNLEIQMLEVTVGDTILDGFAKLTKADLAISISVCNLIELLNNLITWRFSKLFQQSSQLIYIKSSVIVDIDFIKGSFEIGLLFISQSIQAFLFILVLWWDISSNFIDVLFKLINQLLYRILNLVHLCIICGVNNPNSVLIFRYLFDLFLLLGEVVGLGLFNCLLLLWVVHIG